MSKAESLELLANFASVAHRRREAAEDAPVNILLIQAIPEVLARIAQEHVVAEHVVSDIEPDEARIDHEGDLFEKADEVPFLLDRRVPQRDIVGREEVEHFAILRRLQKAAAHLDEVCGSRLMALAHILKSATEKRDEGDDRSENDRGVLGDCEGVRHEPESTSQVAFSEQRTGLVGTYAPLRSMFFSGKSKPHPHLSEYLDQAVARSPYADQDARLFTRAAIGGVGAGVVTLALALVNPLVGILAAIPMFGGVGIWTALGFRRNRASRTAEDERRFQAYGVVQQFHGSLHRRRLHKELDPVAGQLLEACAFYYMKIRTSLDGATWNAAGSHRQALRSQVLAAADTAMEQALILCSSCFGRPRGKDKDDWRDKIEDFIDLDIVDAIEGLTGYKLGDEKRNVYRSPHLPQIFPYVREIAEKIKLLYEETEQMAQSIGKEHTSGIEGTSSIDLVLSEMRSVRQAEAELDQHHRLGG